MDLSDFKDSRDLYVCLNKATIPKSYYLVRPGLNNFILIENNLFNIGITIPIGFYNSSNFLTVVQNLLNTNSVLNYQYTITFDNVTAKYTFSCTGNAVISFPDVSGASIHEQFGCVDSESYNLPFTSPNVVKFVLEDCIFIRSNIVEDPTETLGIVIASGFPNLSTIGYMCGDVYGNSKPIKSSDGNVFSFRLSDPDGGFLDTNGLPLNLEIIVYKPYQNVILKMGDQ
jgi:hypothetical protein